MPGDRRGPRAKNWAFTINNYTPDDVDRLSNGCTSIQYLIFGREVGESGTRHLQGTVIMKVRSRRQQVTTAIGQAHLEVVRNLKNSIEYCKKDGDWTEFGSLPETKQGERTDMDDFKESVKSGITCMKELREKHSDIIARYPKFARDYVDDNTEGIKVSDYFLIFYATLITISSVQPFRSLPTLFENGNKHSTKDSNDHLKKDSSFSSST